jgi:hypothetical protein
MLIERRSGAAPLFSICIPQYNRTPFLLELCRSLAEQTFRDFEVCISDDRSPDGRQAEVVAELERLGLRFVFQVQERNKCYDGNLRTAISLARGRYCLLMGNDDALAGPKALAGLVQDMEEHGPAGVVICDYQDFASGQRALRIRQTQNHGGGPLVAANHYRNFSFVSGVLLEREAAQAVATDKWDGSEMYQTYVGCRLIASGLPLLELERVLVRKDLRVPGESVDSYAAKPPLSPCPIVERRLPLRLLGRLVVDAVQPYLAPSSRQSVPQRALLQLVLFTYPFWILEYRRVQSWRYAAGICLGMRPAIIAEGVELCPFPRLTLTAAYVGVTAAGLLMPLGLFRCMQPRLYRLAKTLFSCRA